MRPCALLVAALVGVQSSQLPIAQCKFANTARNGYGVALGFPRIANRMRSTGVVNFTILFADFSDAVSPDAPETVFARITPAATYYGELSYGKMKPVFSPLLQTLRMPRPSTSYSPSSRQYFLDASAAAVQLGWDFTKSDSIVIMTSSTATHLTNGPAMCASPGGGITVQGKVFENGATSGYDFARWGPRWFNHEIGHTMALVDLYQFNWVWEEFPYTGAWSLMSDIAGAGNGYFSWERWLLGWLDDTEVACVGAGTTTVNLAPLVSQATTPPGSVRTAVVKTGATRGLFVDARSNIGGDTGIPQPGCLCAVIDTSISTGEGPLRVLPLNATGNMLRATLTAGQSLEYEGVKVTCTVVNRDGSMVATIVSACTAVNCPAPATCEPDGTCSA